MHSEVPITNTKNWYITQTIILTLIDPIMNKKHIQQLLQQHPFLKERMKKLKKSKESVDCYTSQESEKTHYQASSLKQQYRKLEITTFEIYSVSKRFRQV